MISSCLKPESVSAPQEVLADAPEGGLFLKVKIGRLDHTELYLDATILNSKIRHGFRLK